MENINPALGAEIAVKYAKWTSYYLSDPYIKLLLLPLSVSTYSELCVKGTYYFTVTFTPEGGYEEASGADIFSCHLEEIKLHTDDTALTSWVRTE